MERAKRDSLFDNLRTSQGTSESGNNEHDIVGNILQENNLHLPVIPGINISLVTSPSVSSTTNRKSSEDDEVKILSQSINIKTEQEAGTSSSTSSNFKGACPLCNLVFERLHALETHANACEGQSADQVRLIY